MKDEKNKSERQNMTRHIYLPPQNLKNLDSRKTTAVINLRKGLVILEHQCAQKIYIPVKSLY